MHKLLSKSNIHSRIASRNHQCCECGKEITTNQHYIHIHGICDGYKLNFIQCNDCHSVFNNAYSVIEDPEEGPCITELSVWINTLVAAYDHHEDFIDTIAASLDVTPDKIRNLYKVTELHEKIA